MLKTETFRGRPFLVTGAMSSNERWCLDSFILENELRHRWWDIRPGDVVIDVGAGYGSYTLPALLSGAAFVVAVEPSREVLFDLVTHLMLNGYQQKCLVLNTLIASGFGCTEYYPENRSLLPCGQAERRYAVSIDELIRRLNPGRVDWIKIDVEGAEVGVLIGSLKTIKDYKPRLLVENHVGYVPGVDEQVREVLRQFGYIEENYHEPQFANNNWSLWTPPEVAERVHGSWRVAGGDNVRLSGSGAPLSKPDACINLDGIRELFLDLYDHELAGPHELIGSLAERVNP